MQQIKLLFKDTFHCVMLEYSICMFCMGNAMKTVSGHSVAIQLISMTNYKEIRVKKNLYAQRVAGVWVAACQHCWHAAE